jgi:hypothetical protein
VPRCPGSKPGRVAAVSLATDTTTPILAWFSTSNLKVEGEAVGGFGDGRNGGVLFAGVAATVADGSEVGGGEVGLGVGAHATRVTRSAANARRIFRLAPMREVIAVRRSRPVERYDSWIGGRARNRPNVGQHPLEKTSRRRRSASGNVRRVSRGLRDAARVSSTRAVGSAWNVPRSAGHSDKCRRPR